MEIQRVRTVAADFDVAGLIAQFLYGLDKCERQFCLVHADKDHDFEFMSFEDRKAFRLASPSSLLMVRRAC